MSEQTNGYIKRKRRGGKDRFEDLVSKETVWKIWSLFFVGIGKPLNHIPFSLSRRGSSHLLMLFEMAVIPINSKQAQCLAHSMA